MCSGHEYGRLDKRDEKCGQCNGTEAREQDENANGSIQNVCVRRRNMRQKNGQEEKVPTGVPVTEIAKGC